MRETAKPEAAHIGHAARTSAWMAQAADLAERCALTGADMEADRLNDAIALFSCADRPDGLPLGEAPDRGRMSAMIAAGGTLDAALVLLGPRAGYMISRGGDGNCMATVVLPGHPREQTAQGVTAALALLGALLAALAALVGDGLDLLDMAGSSGGARLH